MKKYDATYKREERPCITVRDLAAELGINLNGAYNLCKKPGFPAIRVSERRIVIPREALNNWLMTNAGTM